MPSGRDDVLAAIRNAFPPGALCSMTLRQGEALDDYATVPDEVAPSDWHSISDEDLQDSPYGVHYLDDVSKRYYLPAFLSYSVRHAPAEDMVTFNCLHTLLRPDGLSHEQKAAVREALEYLAFDTSWEVRNAEALAALDRWEAL
jgi:hypothetical protein